MTAETPTITYVGHLPELITSDDYAVTDQRKLVRIQLRLTADGLEILGDSPYPERLEELLASLDPAVIEMMLCG